MESDGIRQAQEKAPTVPENGGGSRIAVGVRTTGPQALLIMAANCSSEALGEASNCCPKPTAKLSG